MEIQQAKNLIEKVNEKIKNNPYLYKTINRGGCGWYAAILKYILEYQEINCEFICLNSWEGIYPRDRKYYKTNISKPRFSTSASHVLLKIKDGRKRWYVDAKGFIPLSTARKKWGKIQASFQYDTFKYIVHALVHKPNDWNCDFNPHRSVSILLFCFETSLTEMGLFDNEMQDFCIKIQNLLHNDQ